MKIMVINSYKPLVSFLTWGERRQKPDTKHLFWKIIYKLTQLKLIKFFFCDIVCFMVSTTGYHEIKRKKWAFQVYNNQNRNKGKIEADFNENFTNLIK